MSVAFKSRLKKRERLFGTIVSMPEPAAAEILAGLGFDWLFIDGEHGALETGEMSAILQTVGNRIPCVARVPAAEEAPIKKFLDLGAAGIIAPQVNTPEHAAQVVSWARYAPEGSRGVGLGRASGYGMNFKEYLEGANDSVSVIVQAEHIDAVANIEKIVRVPGVDAVLLGPYDLSASMGKMGQVQDTEVVGAIDRVIAACDAVGLPFGYFGVTAEAMKPYIERGCSLIVAGQDTLFLGTAAREMLDAIR